MISRSRLVPFLLSSLAVCALIKFASADPKLPMMFVPPAPAGYLLVDEEMWSQLMDEAGRHLDRARDAYLNAHFRTAASEFRKAAIMMRIDAAHGKDRGDLALLKAAHDLEHLSQRLLNPQGVDTIDDLDAVASRALIALSDHEHIKADLAWKQRRVHQSAYYLRAAADNLERAGYRARVAMSSTTSGAVKNARLFSSRLIDGAGYAVDEVGLGIEALGHQIKHFSHEILKPLPERRE